MCVSLCVLVLDDLEVLCVVGFSSVGDVFVVELEYLDDDVFVFIVEYVVVAEGCGDGFL